MVGKLFRSVVVDIDSSAINTNNGDIFLWMYVRRNHDGRYSAQGLIIPLLLLSWAIN